MRLVKSTVPSFAAILVTAGVLMLCGCSGSVEQATAANVNNRSFTFPTGVVFQAALANMPTTLTFTNNANAFILSSTAGSAAGTNVVGSCILTVTTSTYSPGTGPQVNDVLTLDPCDFDNADNTLSVTNGTITATSAPAVTVGQ